MSAEEEAVAVAFRKHTLLPLGDDPAPHPLSPAPLLPAAPHQPAPETLGDKAAKKTFKRYPLCQAWVETPERFRLDPVHLTSGLNT